VSVFFSRRYGGKKNTLKDGNPEKPALLDPTSLAYAISSLTHLLHSMGPEMVCFISKYFVFFIPVLELFSFKHIV
jgi:hypothetical protein